MSEQLKQTSSADTNKAKVDYGSTHPVFLAAPFASQRKRASG